VLAVSDEGIEELDVVEPDHDEDLVDADGGAEDFDDGPEGDPIAFRTHQDFLALRTPEGKRKWYAKLGDYALALPPRLGRLARLARVAQEDSIEGSALHETLGRINCHKSALYALGLITKKQLLATPSYISKNMAPDEKDSAGRHHFSSDALGLSKKEFEPLELYELTQAIGDACQGDKLCVVQVGTSEYEEFHLQHTFLAGVGRLAAGSSSRFRGGGDNIICFDKLGFEDRPFRSPMSLRDIYSGVGQASEDDEPGTADFSADHFVWRVIPVTEIEGQKLQV
jgi:hypothetical protein